MKEIRLFIEEDIHTRFKTKVASKKETMQGVLYEAVVKYLMEK